MQIVGSRIELGYLEFFGNAGNVEIRPGQALASRFRRIDKRRAYDSIDLFEHGYSKLSFV